MKRTPVVFNRLIIALALATQLFLLVPASQAARQMNPPAPVVQDKVNHEGHNNMRASNRRRSSSRCRERCLRQYRQCLRGVVNPNQARCRRRYRDCLRRCLR